MVARPETKYIKSLVAKILESPDHGSKLIVAAVRSDKVNEIKIQDKWSYVKHESKNAEGWIPSLLLTDQPPMATTSLLQKNVDISQNARMRASAFTSTAAARGLKSDSDDVFKQLGSGNYEALKSMEEFFVDAKDGLRFLFAGLNQKRTK